jgi:hypothetical protein
MSLKLKALGLGLLATLAMSSFAVMNATANTEGHIVAEQDHWNLKVTEGEEVDPETGQKHRVHLISHGIAGEIGCTEPNYGNPTFTAATQGDITLTPTFNGCSTTGSSAVTVTMNGCSYTFRVAKNTVDTTEQTAHLICPAGKSVEIHHPNCTIIIHPQTVTTGITLTTKTTLNKHYLTVDVKVQFTSTYEGGICVFTGTNHTGTLSGSATVEAFDTEGKKIGLTAT